MKLTINNQPEYANHYEFIVVRVVDGEYWFWGAYDDGYKAGTVASAIAGVVVHNVRIQGYKP